MARRVPLHRSLLVRLLATSMAIALCAIASTAWVTVQLTKRAVTQEQSRTLSADTHDSWDGVDATVRRLAGLTRSRIALTTPDRRLIAGSSPDAGEAARVSEVPTATVDPLYLDTGIARVSGGRIDPRAVGPYKLTAAERRLLHKAAENELACMTRGGWRGEIVELPSGRPTVRRVDVVAEAVPMTACEVGPGLDEPVASERKPLTDLARLMRECDSSPRLTITPQFTVVGQELDGSLGNCLNDSRRAQLKAYVAPPALLFVTGQTVAAPPVDLSRTNQLRIAGTAALILALAFAASIFVGLRLVRPLRALTEAARRPVDSQGSVPVTTRDEIGYLATAFNDLSERRKALEEQRKAMVNDIAHELRTPLTNIRTWLETAREGVVEIDAEVLDLLVEESVQLHHMVDDLRDLAAADAGTLHVHPEVTFVKDLLEQVLEAHRTAGVTLRLAAEADPEVAVDPVRLRQIAGNLVSNAIRHAPGGTVTVRLALAGDRLVVAVADTGEGIAPEDLPKVFDRFWRADGSRSRETGGSGLGLAISRQLARAHGGELTATSVPGRGSVFTVELPIQR
jgi:two-component system, OmpR family, sensor histidine kinase BaeS